MFTKINIYVIGISIAIFFLVNNSFAQLTSKKTTFKSIVFDAVGQVPIENVTVTLNTAQNDLISKTLSQKNGSFSFLLVEQMPYVITFSAIGYNQKSIQIIVNDSTFKRFENIQLLPSQKSLSTVSVSTNKKIIKQEIDRLSYDLQADPESKSSNVLEIMKKIPMLSVDGNDNLELKGSSNYKILINGKPSAMMERNVKEVLRSMPASTLQKIEVITTPPSKYDAEGLTGLINIITNKTEINGYNGTANLNFAGPTGGPGSGASFAAKVGNFGITAFSGAGIYNTPSTSDFTIIKNQNNNLHQQNNKEKDSKSGYFGTEISYEIDSLNLISASFNINRSKYMGLRDQLSVNTGQLIQQYLLKDQNKGNGQGKDISLNYQLGFAGNKKQMLTLSYRYYDYGSKNNNEISFSERLNYNQPDYRQHDDGNSSEQTIQLDYTSAIKKLNVEAGIKSIFRSNSSDFSYLNFNSISGIFELDNGQSNRFSNTQNVYAAYNSYQFNAGNLGIKAGIRMEYTHIDADFKSTNTSLKQQQFNVLPTVALSYKLNTSSSFNLGFTQRIQRPGIYQLNPFVNRSNPNVETSGNPDLHPVISNGLQLGYSLQRKLSLNISLDYTEFNSLINQVANYDPALNITRISYQNTGNAKLAGANININYPFSKNWMASSNSKIFYGAINGISNNEPIHTSGFMFATGLNSTYKFQKGWKANASINYRSASFNLQRKSNAVTSTSLSISKELIANKLTFSISSSNPFSKYRSNTTTLSGPDFEQITTDVTYFRSYRISLNYNFGKLKEAIKKNVRSIKNDDISN